MCASTGWLGVGIPCGGGGRSAKGKEGLAGGWVRVEWWLVCGVAAWAGKAYHAKWRSRRVDRTEKRSTTHRRLNSRSARAEKDALGASTRDPGRQGTRRHDLQEGHEKDHDATVSSILEHVWACLACVCCGCVCGSGVRRQTHLSSRLVAVTASHMRGPGEGWGRGRVFPPSMPHSEPCEIS